MGQAKKRGTYEERKAQSKQRVEDERKKRQEEWNKHHPQGHSTSNNDVIRSVLEAAARIGGRGY